MLNIKTSSFTLVRGKASWYEIWEAAVAMSSVCARRSLSGSMEGMGKSYDPVLLVNLNQGLMRQGLHRRQWRSAVDSDEPVRNKSSQSANGPAAHKVLWRHVAERETDNS